MKMTKLACALLFTAAPSAAAFASPVIVGVGADYSATPYSFSFGGGTFTFSGTGDIFNPTAVKTQGGAEVNAFGGFLGIPLQPTTNFIDRGTVTFGPGMNFAAFAAGATVPFSNGDNFIGLRSTLNGQTFYGFAYTTDTKLNAFGFETVADAVITAVAPVPEPAAWALMIAGFGLTGAALRRRSVKSAFSRTA